MVSDLKTFAHKGCKIAAAKKVFLTDFFICSLRLNVFLPPLPEVQCPNFLDLRNPWGKVMERSGWKLLLIKGVKSPRKKKLVFSANFALLAGFFWYWCYYPHRSRDALSPVCGIFLTIYLRFMKLFMILSLLM